MKSEPIDMKRVSEPERLAFYGALFSLAAADGDIAKEEINQIFEVLDLDGLSDEARRTVHGYLAVPPSLSDCVRKLSRADERLRFGLMIQLIEVAMADDDTTTEEEHALTDAAGALGITSAQVASIRKFVAELRKIRTRGLDDEHAKDAVKSAGAGLAAAGIPIAAVYFSGTVIGMSAAGITSGLAALGLGLGMIPGIGVAILLGAAIFVGVNRLLDTGGKRKKAELQVERERRAQLVIQNLQNTINALMDKVRELAEQAAGAGANRDAIRQLTERIRLLQQLVTRRKSALEGV